MKNEPEYKFFQNNQWHDLFNLSSEIFIIETNINISNMNLKELPDLSNMICLGSFDCSSNELKTLKGAPKEVRGMFNCRDNNLTSLEYGPKKAYDYDCSWNDIKTLKGCPEELHTFNCYANCLTSLIGGPKQTDFYDCSSNELTSLNGSPRKVKHFICAYNRLRSLEGGPRIVDVYDCYANKFDDGLKGIPVFCDKFIVSNRNLKNMVSEKNTMKK